MHESFGQGAGTGVNDRITIDMETKTVKVEADKCLGCGGCTFVRKKDALRLEHFDRSIPFDSIGILMKAF